MPHPFSAEGSLPFWCQSTSLDSGDSSPTHWNYRASRQKRQCCLQGLWGLSEAAATPTPAVLCCPLLTSACTKCQHIMMVNPAPGAAGWQCPTGLLSWFTQPLELLAGWDHASLERSISSRFAVGRVTTASPAGAAAVPYQLQAGSALAHCKVSGIPSRDWAAAGPCFAESWNAQLQE